MSEAEEIAVEFSGPETVTEWRVRLVDAKGVRATQTYRLRHRREERQAVLKDGCGAEVAATAGMTDEAELRAWAGAHARRDMARRPDPRQRAYEVVARIATGPAAGSTAGSRRVLARTSAEALDIARRGWDLTGELGPGEHDIVLAASAQEDPRDASTACQFVEAGRPTVPGEPRGLARAVAVER